MNNLLGDEIGRGGFGIVYIKKDDPSLCIKVSNKNKEKNQSCRQWSNEFKKIKDFMTKIIDHSSYKKLDMVRVVNPIDFIDTNDSCYVILPRIFRPEGRDDKQPTIQAQIGWKSVRIVHKGRGEFIGLKEILEYISKEDLHKACFELGVMMALIHHVGKNDAYDVELYLGKEANSKKCRFYIADFDLSDKIIEYNTETIERITWSMDAIPYFPKASCDSQLFELFRKGYDTIETTGTLSDKIFEEYD